MWIAFIKWMPIICLIDHFSETALVVFVSTIEKRLQNQVYRQWKANLWIHLDLAKVHRLKGLTSLYIVSYLHFLNLNNILTLPKLLSSLKLGLIRHDLCLTCFLPVRFTRMRTSLRNQSKCKPSISQVLFKHCIQEHEK